MHRFLVSALIICLGFLCASDITAQENEPDNLHPSDEARQMIERFSNLPLSGVLDCEKVESARTVMQGLRILVPLPAGVNIEPVDADDVPAAWFIPDGAPEAPVIYYLHGGGYIAGSLNDGYRSYIARLAKFSGLRVFAIEYRLAPENPYPAALEDSLTAFDWLLNEVSLDQIVIAGDSAGGNLTLATLLVLKQSEVDMPVGAVLISPWLDMTLSGTTVESMASVEPVLSADGLTNDAECYANGIPLDDPRVSPLFADLSGLPPVVLHVGTGEILLADSTRFARRMQQFGGDVTLNVWDGMIHVWALYSATLPEGQQLFQEVGGWVREIIDETAP